MVQAGVRNVSELIAAARKIIEVHPDAVIDYIEIFDPETIESLTVVDSPARMALAVKIGKTRLIDNTLLTP